MRVRGVKADLGLAGGVKVALGDENSRAMDLPTKIQERLDALGVLPSSLSGLAIGARERHRLR